MRWVGVVAAAALTGGPAAAEPLYRDASANLPLAATTIRSMDAAAFDADGDGDQDVVVAHEFGANLLLLNDGAARFALAPNGMLPLTVADHEDIAAADMDGDGDVDLVVVCEDDQAKALFLNDGKGVFADASARLPQKGVSNGVAVGDVDGDGDLDIVTADAGPDQLWLNDGAAQYVDGSGRLPQPPAGADPAKTHVSQDVKLGDVDGDRDLDIVFGNEDGNSLYLNDGRGSFTDTGARLPRRAAWEETRKIALGDVDGDGDLDLYAANVRFFWRDAPTIADPQDRLLINDGTGAFADETAARLPAEQGNTAHAALADLDADGDLDVVATEVTAIAGAGQGRLRALLNDGKGVFRDATDAVFPASAAGNGFDTAAADFDGDGRSDLYVANRIGADVLLLRAH